MEQIKKISINDIEYQIVDETALHDGDMPTTLPNPYALTFTGAATIAYDGSEEATIDIHTVAGVDAHNVDSSAHADIREQISQLSSEKVNQSELTNAVNVALAEAKASGEFDGIDGNDGKSAYEYAKDGGYTGTEAEFATKFAFIMGYSVFGYVDEHNNIIFKSDITNGEYTVKYEMEDGSTIDIGELELGTEVEPEPDSPTYTNFADTTSADWKEGYRLTTNIDELKELTGGVVTNYIEVQNGDVVTCEGINFQDGNNRIAHANGVNGENIKGIGTANEYKTVHAPSGIFADVSFDANSVTLTVTCNTTHMRFSGLATGASQDVIVKITRNGALL